MFATLVLWLSCWNWRSGKGHLKAQCLVSLKNSELFDPNPLPVLLRIPAPFQPPGIVGLRSSCSLRDYHSLMLWSRAGCLCPWKGNGKVG